MLTPAAWHRALRGHRSTVGGLGVMVDELTVGLASLGARVAVVSPFYHRDRKGRTEYVYGLGFVALCALDSLLVRG